MRHLGLLCARGVSARSLAELKNLTVLRLRVRNGEWPQFLGALARANRITSLNLSNSGVRSLEPLRGWTALRSLDLRRTSISASSLKTLRGLPRLETLRLPALKAVDVGTLTALTGLKTLQLTVPATGIGQLRQLKALTALTLTGTVTSIEPLQDLPRLENLDLSGAILSDRSRVLKTLGKLRSLRRVRLKHTSNLLMQRPKPIAQPRTGRFANNWLSLRPLEDPEITRLKRRRPRLTVVTRGQQLLVAMGLSSGYVQADCTAVAPTRDHPFVFGGVMRGSAPVDAHRAGEDDVADSVAVDHRTEAVEPGQRENVEIVNVDAVGQMPADAEGAAPVAGSGK